MPELTAAPLSRTQATIRHGDVQRTAAPDGLIPESIAYVK